MRGRTPRGMIVCFNRTRNGRSKRNATDQDCDCGTLVVHAADLGVLEARGERRGRYYIAGQPLREIREHLKAGRKPLESLPHPGRRNQTRSAVIETPLRSILFTAVRSRLTMLASSPCFRPARSRTSRTRAPKVASFRHVCEFRTTAVVLHSGSTIAVSRSRDYQSVRPGSGIWMEMLHVSRRGRRPAQTADRCRFKAEAGGFAGPASP